MYVEARSITMTAVQYAEFRIVNTKYIGMSRRYNTGSPDPRPRDFPSSMLRLGYIYRCRMSHSSLLYEISAIKWFGFNVV